MLVVNPEERISAVDALNHAWIKTENKKALTLHSVMDRMSI
jgi:hypothetical protein